MTPAVFLSSTSRDLVDHRARVRDALDMAGFRAVDMIDFGAQPDEPERACLGELAAADIFIGIYAYRYGFVPTDSPVSITEAELNHAERLGKPVFCFVVGDGHHWRGDCSDVEKRTEQLAKLHGRVRQRYVVTAFTTPDDLATRVVASLSRWEQKRGSSLTPVSGEYELITPPSFGAQPPDVRPAIPSVLLQVVDRTPQVQMLQEKLRRQHGPAAGPSKPLVFVVLGSTDDAQEGLVQLYREDILPRFITDERAVVRNLYAPVVWPPSGYTVDYLRRDMAAALFLSADATDQIIHDRLASGTGAHSLAYFIDAEHWSHSDSDLLLSWMHYWNAFPAAAAGKVVTIFICLQYSPSLWDVAKRRRIQRFYRTVQQAFDASSNILCLPPLGAINRAHVVQWANTGVPSRSNRFNASILKSAATRRFGPTTQEIPLDLLMPTLKEALQLAQVTHASGPPPWSS